MLDYYCVKVYKKNSANGKENAQQRCMFESPVKQNLSQLPEGTRRPVANYLWCFTHIHQRMWPVLLSQCHIGWKWQIFPTPSHLAPSFGVTSFEFIEKLYSSW